jgi:hypothetical protein
MKNFDQFIGVDWSGSKAINTTSISVAVCAQGGKAPKLLPDMRSRSSVVDFILTLVKEGKRTLIGIDANFGYAHKVGRKHFGSDYTALDQWRVINEYSKDNKNFYTEGFWSDEKFRSDFWMEGKMPVWFSYDLLRRDTERQCIKDGYGKPESPFKLFSPTQVGKGGMAAMRVAYYLKRELGDDIAIWPFENSDDAKIVLTEIYPRQFLMRAGWGTKKVETLPDLNNLLPYFKSDLMAGNAVVTNHDTDALVSAAGLRYLCGMESTLPKNLINPQGMSVMARRCEGWIFGVGDQGRDKAA